MSPTCSEAVIDVAEPVDCRRPIADVCARVRAIARDQDGGALCSANVPRVGLRPPLLLDFAAQRTPPPRSDASGLFTTGRAPTVEAGVGGCRPQRNQGRALGAAQGGGHSRRRAPAVPGRRDAGACHGKRLQWAASTALPMNCRPQENSAPALSGFHPVPTVFAKQASVRHRYGSPPAALIASPPAVPPPGEESGKVASGDGHFNCHGRCCSSTG